VIGVPRELDTYQVLDDRFNVVRGDAALEPLWTGCRWAEGPAYFPASRTVVWSDIPNDRLLRYDETTGSVGVFRSPAGHPNGNTVDAQGRLVTCEHSGRRISRTEHDGSVTLVVDSYRGRRLNSPNDAVVAGDGAVWFTDASYGIGSDYEGRRAEQELDGCYLFRADPATGSCEIVADGFLRPTGIAFSPGGTRLYVADSRANTIRVFEVTDDGSRLRGGHLLATGTAPSLDSMAVDTDGRIWIACSDGVRCYEPEEGVHLGTIRTPDAAANVTFGGPRRNVLYVCATTTLYSIMLAVNGLGGAVG